MRDPGEVCGALQEHRSIGWVIQAHSGLAAGGSWASQTWPPSSTSALDLLWRLRVNGQHRWWLWPAKLPSLLLRFVFSGLSQVLTMQPSIPAGQGGQAGRWVCPAAGGGGLWQPVQQLVASWRPGTLLCRAVISTCTCCPISVTVWAEDIISWAGWLGRWFHPCPGALQSCRSHPARGWGTSPALPAPTQSFPAALDHKQSTASKNWPKKKTRSQCHSTKRGGNKPQISHLLDQSYCKLHRRGFFYGLSFARFCTSASMTKGSNNQKVVTATKFPLCDLPQQHSSQGALVPSSPLDYWPFAKPKQSRPYWNWKKTFLLCGCCEIDAHQGWLKAQDKTHPAFEGKVH